MTNKILYNVYDVFYPQFSHQHVSVAIAGIFNAMLLLQETKVQKLVSWVAVTPK